jgi:hypothetical protein
MPVLDNPLQAVLDGAFGAISLDTDSFERERLRLSSGRLALLRNFKAGKPRLVLTDVVLSELSAHLFQELIVAQEHISRALIDAQDVIQLPSEQMAKAREALTTLHAQEITKNQLDSFRVQTNFLTLRASDYAILKPALELYFSASPPFSESAKPVSMLRSH